MQKIVSLFCLSFLFTNIIAQSTQSLVNEVSLDALVKTVREFSGEDSVSFNDSTVRIVHRVSTIGNNLASDYLVSRLESYGLSVETIDYRKRGRNVVATLVGRTNPDSVYYITAHYDAVTDYCADDNASGSATVLEAARIMSKYCFHNTVKFAFWDEEELGLFGSQYHADSANANGEAILGVINMDMMGYDGDSNKVFDIHTNSNQKNQSLKDTLLFVLDTLKIDLVPNVINPGTTRSDHASFWKHSYPAVFCGESFIGGDPNPAYHSVKDRINLFDLTYYHNLAQLVIGTVVELAGVVPPVIIVDTVSACTSFTYNDTTFFTSTVYTDSLKTEDGCDSFYILDLEVITINDSIYQDISYLTAIDSFASYQWVSCESVDYKDIVNASERSYEASKGGYYAVALSKKQCRDTSSCKQITYLELFRNSHSAVYPNPSNGIINIETIADDGIITIDVYALDGKNVGHYILYGQKEMQIKLHHETGMYMVRIQSDLWTETHKVIKL